MAAYRLTEDGNGVVRTSDGVCIPFAHGNKDYAEYQAWVAADNTPDPAFTLEQLIERKCNDVDDKRDAVLDAGMTYSGKVLQTDSKSEQRIGEMGAKAKIALIMGASFPSGFGWIMADNSFLPLDAAGMSAMADAADYQISAWIFNAYNHKQAIRALTDPAAVASYDFSTGW